MSKLALLFSCLIGYNAKVLPLLAQAQTIQSTPDTWTVLIHAPGTPTAYTSVKLSLFGGIHNGRIGEPEMTSDDILIVASLEDLFAHKLKVILQRIEAKDYRDRKLLPDRILNDTSSGGCHLARSMLQLRNQMS